MVQLDGFGLFVSSDKMLGGVVLGRERALLSFVAGGEAVVEEAAELSADNGGENVDGEPAGGAVGAEYFWSPAGDGGDDAGTEITGGVEAGHGEGGEE